MEQNGIHNPCRKCKDRSATCHGDCKLYADYRKEVNEYNAKIKQEKQKESLGIPLHKKKPRRRW